jgi:hypothetical protein
MRSLNNCGQFEGSGKMKIKERFCCWVIIILIVLSFIIYSIQFFKFDNKIRKFDKLSLGTKEIEIYISLGRPSKTIGIFSAKDLKMLWDIELQNSEFEKKRYMLLIYDGTIYFKKDLFLFIDIDTEKLVYKMKKFEYVIGDVVYDNIFGFK